MAVSRYAYSSKTANGGVSSSNASWRVLRAVENGSIPFSTRIVRGHERLDHIAAQAYGSSQLWWIIAAASGIGWGLQVPPGTILRVPKSVGAVMNLVK